MSHDMHPATAAVLLLAALCVSAALLEPSTLRYGHDIFYHLLRIESLYDQLRLGVWASPINYLFFGGAGYASSACYPDALLYIPAALRLAGLNPGSACTVFILLCMAASCGTAYWCARQMTGSRWAGVVAAIIYTLCQYKLDCVYTRGALGEIQAFIFIPVAICAVHDLLFRDFRQPWLMLPGFGGLMLTHTISLFMAVLISAVICLVFLKRVWPHIPALAGMALLTLGLTAFFWLPCVEMLLTMPLKAAQPWTTAAENAVEPAMLLANVPLGQSRAGMGMVLFLLCLPRLALFGRTAPQGEAGARWLALRRLADFGLLAGLACALAATTLFPWRHAGFAGVIQFPWRLYSFASWFLALGAAASLGCLLEMLRAGGKRIAARKTGGGLSFALACGVLACMSVAAWQHYGLLSARTFVLAHDVFAAPAETVFVGKEEWMPQAVDRNLLMRDDRHAEDDAGRHAALSVSPDKCELRSELDARSRQWLDVPYIWYRGYAAEFLPRGGGAPERLTVNGAGRNGFCRVLLEGRGAGMVRVWYEGTAGQRAARWITVLSWLALSVLLARRWRTAEKRAGQAAGRS
ncbi:MAG: hypothetical protein ACI33N_00630 [Desulfovibrionaceae bacterium]